MNVLERRGANHKSSPMWSKCGILPVTTARAADMLIERFFFTAIFVFTAFTVTSCSSAAKADRRESIGAAGNASLEGVKNIGLTVTRIFLIKIDGQLLQPKGTKGVYPLTPGPHDVQMQCDFGRLPNVGSILGAAVDVMGQKAATSGGGVVEAPGDFIIDAGGATLHLKAKAGVHYRLAGKKLNNSQAEVWIEDVETEKSVIAVTKVSLEPNRQDIPSIPVYIPAAR